MTTTKGIEDLEKFKKNILKLLFVTITLFYSNSIFAYDYKNPKEYNLAGIRFEGVKYLDERSLIGLTDLNLYQKISLPSQELTWSVQSLWKEKLFSDIKLYIDKIEGDDLYLLFEVKEIDRLYRIKYNNASSSDRKDFNEEFQSFIGKSLSKSDIQFIKNKISEKYIEKGFYKTTISDTVFKHKILRNKNILELTINKNKKVKISKIYIKGNENVSDKKVRKYLKNTKQNTAEYFFRKSRFIRTKFEEDKNKLIEEYNAKGYRDFKITKDSINEKANGEVEIYIDVEEGNKYYLGNINWIGNRSYNTDFLNILLKLKKGDIYDNRLLNERLRQSKDEDDVSSLYLNNGFLFFNVNPVETKVYNDTVDLEIRIFEGEKATIRVVNLTGNNSTSDRIIIRTLRSKPGYFFSRSDITRTFKELSQYNYLNPEDFNIVPVPNPETGTVDLNYQVGERSADQIELQGGYGGNSFIGSLGLVLNNFSLRNVSKRSAWRPLPEGDGQRVSIRAQTNGINFQNYSISFSEPWLGGKKPISFSFNLSHSIQKSFSRNTLGSEFGSGLQVSTISMGIGKRLKFPDDFFTLSTGISYQFYKLDNYNGVFAFTDGTSHNLSFTVGLGRNSTNHTIYPTAGANISTSLRFTLPYSLFSNKDFKSLNDNDLEDQQEKYKLIEFYKLKFDLNQYINPFGKFVISSKFLFGYLGSYNQDLDPVPFNRFFMGGSGLSGFSLQGREIIALRGYNDNSVSPTIGSEAFSKIQIEFRYPLISNNYANIYALMFYEGGNTWNKINNIDPLNIKKSTGFGIRMFLPAVGLLGIDWGYRLDEIENFPSMPKSQFHFIIGPQY